MSTALAPRGVREREIKLAAPPGFRLLDLGAVADGVVVTAGEERHLVTVYWDTPDLRLIRWGCTLRHRAGEGWTVKLPQASEGIAMVRNEHRIEGPATHPPEEAADLLRAMVRSAPLEPVARMRTVRRVVALLSAEGRPLAEIDDDEVSVYHGRRVAARFREIEVEINDGCPDELVDAVLERLHEGGAGRPDPTPKLVRALGDRALAPPEVVVPDLDPAAATAGDVIRAAIAGSAARLIRHDPGVRIGGHPEDVHQARVATRRMRSDLRTFAGLVEPEWAAGLRQELSELADELGTVRDAEVLRDRLKATARALPGVDHPAARRIAGQLTAAVTAGRRRLLATMREPGYIELLDHLVEAADAPRLGPGAAAPAREALPAIVAVPWQSLRRGARRADENSPDEELHALRIKAKRCRYAAEAAAPVLGRRAAEFAKAVAGLQEVLGEHHDAVVAGAWLRENAGQGPEAFVAGELCALEAVAAQGSRKAWPDAWKKVSRKELRAWM